MTPEAARNYIVDPENGCWIWQGARDACGYGRLWDGKTVIAHRAFYEHHVGEAPEGLTLDHLCRNPSCVNPDHLEPVTQARNVRRGRLAKITEEDAEEIRSLASSGMEKAQIAERFPIGALQVHMIATGRAWAAEQ